MSWLRPLALALAMTALMAIGVAHHARADDADTLTVDGGTYRLDGIDAPEIDQNCLNEEGTLYPCGLKAVAELEKFVAGRPISCDDLRADPVYTCGWW